MAKGLVIRVDGKIFIKEIDEVVLSNDLVPGDFVGAYYAKGLVAYVSDEPERLGLIGNVCATEFLKSYMFELYDTLVLGPMVVFGTEKYKPGVVDVPEEICKLLVNWEEKQSGQE